MNNSAILSLIRAALKIGGGYFIAKGVVSEADWETAAAVFITLFGVIWGMIDRSGTPPPRAAGIVAIFAGLSLFTGCMAAQVPKLKMEIDPANRVVSFENPKDMSVSNFLATFDTNGTFHLSWDALQSGMNPAVITTTGDAQAKMISAAAGAVGDAVTKAVTATVKP